MGVAISNKVEIKCFLTQEQIENVVGYVSKSLPNNLENLSDIDELMYDNAIRVCVDFEIGIFGDLEIKAAEILNSDWDVLKSDSFALSQRLEAIVNDYNRQYKESYNQAIEIRRDQLNYPPYSHY